jgi:NADP-dependent 3-hydroxy acid dehydrogenase YdfG
MTDMIRSIRNIHITDDYVLKDRDIAEAVIYALGTPEKVEVCTDEMAIHKTIHTVTSLSKIIVTYFNP